MNAERISSEEASTKARPRSEAFGDAVGDGWLEGLRFTARKDVGLLEVGTTEVTVGLSILWRLRRMRYVCALQ
jgi:hypothetical protein